MQIFEYADYRNRAITDYVNSIKDSPNYPEGFQARKKGTTKNKVTNMELLEKLRQRE